MMLSYQEAVELIKSCTPLFNHKQRDVGKESSDRLAQRIDQFLGSPSTHYPIIHVAGTNGKGSVVTKIAQALSKASWKVGVHVSPHLFCVRERIKIGEEWISEEEFAECSSKVLQAFLQEGIRLHFFEMLTAIAFLYFWRQGVDVVVLEAGIGGRFDTTNFIKPILSIITSISLDHMPLIGNNLEEIAHEKAGIIKEGVPVVLGPTAIQASLFEEARKCKAPVYAVPQEDVFYDIENQKIAKQALELLQERFSLKQEHIAYGLGKKPSCRFEQPYLSESFKKRFSSLPPIILMDVAHNEEGFYKLIQEVLRRYPNSLIRFYLGLSKEKDHKRCLSLLAQYASYIHISPTQHAKLLTSSELLTCVEQIGFQRAGLESSVEATLNHAIKQAALFQEPLVICGSFCIMHDVKKYFESFKN